MYRERKFENWVTGLIHLAIVIVIPIFPAIIYMITNGKSDSYLYVLLMVAVISLIYEFMSGYNGNCSMWLKVECVASSVALIGLLLVSIFFLFFSFAEGSGPKDLTVGDYFFLAPFLVPVAATVTEIIRCIVYDFQASRYQPDENNLKGAFKV